MKVNVLGLGESLKEFKEDGSITIGVNDIHSKVKTDYVVCIDVQKAFNRERLKTILKTNCKGFYSQSDEWELIDNFTKIEFNKVRGLLNGLDSERFCYSNNSTYVAVILAYKLGAKEIVIWGADFVTHPNFKNHSFDRVIEDFKALNKALKERGVNLFVGSDYSVLSKFLPLANK